MEALLKILIGVGVLVYYVVKAVKTAKAQNANKPTISPKPRQQERGSELDKIFDFEKQAPSVKPSKPVAKTERFSPTKQSSQFSQKTQPKHLVEEEEEELNDILVDFDPRKAIIYSEILKSPYL